MLRTIVAIERDGIEYRTLSLIFEVPNKDFNLIQAVKNASTDWCKTKEGKATYEYNCSYFNWADFAMGVPNEFCKKYGFERVDSILSDIEVNWDEQLVDYDDEEECSTFRDYGPSNPWDAPGMSVKDFI